MRPCPNLNHIMHYYTLHYISHNIAPRFYYRFYAQNSPRLLLEPSASQDIQHNSFSLETLSKARTKLEICTCKRTHPFPFIIAGQACMRISVSKKVVHHATGKAADVAVSSAAASSTICPARWTVSSTASSKEGSVWMRQRGLMLGISSSLCDENQLNLNA